MALKTWMRITQRLLRASFRQLRQVKSLQIEFSLLNLSTALLDLTLKFLLLSFAGPKSTKKRAAFQILIPEEQALRLDSKKSFW